LRALVGAALLFIMLACSARAGYTVDPAEIAKLKDTVLRADQCFTPHVSFTPTKTGYSEVTARAGATTRSKRDTSDFSAIVVSPNPLVSGYDWLRQWVVKDSINCTKNPVAGYAGMIRLTNSGTAPARVRSIEIVGPDASPEFFQFDNSSRATAILVGDEVRPGDTLRQRVIFLPREERVYQVVVRVTTEAGDTVLGSLTGIGVESHGEITGFHYDTTLYTGPYPGTPSQRRQVIITARPTRPLTITNIALDGADAGDYWIDPTELALLPITLQPGESDTIDVEFRPSAPGLRTARIYFNGDQSMCDDSDNDLLGYVASSLAAPLAGSGARRALAVSAGAGGVVAVECALPRGSVARIEIFDELGRSVVTLADGYLDAGGSRMQWDGSNEPSGIYYCRVNAGTWSRTVPFVLAR
jgi:hypothetical protein